MHFSLRNFLFDDRMKEAAKVSNVYLGFILYV